MIVGSIYRAYFELYKTNNTPGELESLSGKVKADFDVAAFKNGAFVTLDYDIREVDAINAPGFYVFEFVPDEATDYYIEFDLDGDPLNPDFLIDGQAYMVSIDDLLMGGNRSVTITVIKDDGSLTPIQGVTVDVYNSAMSLRMTGIPLVTNSEGKVTFAAQDGLYRVRMIKAGFNFTNPEILTVAGNTLVDYEGSTDIVTEPPVPADAIRVYEWCFMPDGVTPMTSITGSATIIKLPYDHNGRLHSGQKINPVYDNVSGRAYWDLAPGCEVDFFIKYLHSVNIRKTVPDTVVGNEIRLSADWTPVPS